MFGKSAFVIALAGAALVVPALSGCHASFQAGSEPAAAPTTPAPPPAPPPPPAPVATTPPPPAPAPAPAAPAVDAKGKVSIPGQIEFDTGKATFKQPSTESDKVIDQVKLFLEQNPKVSILRIEGHTDNVGDKASNLALSGARALTVKNAIIAKGVPATRLVASGFGDTVPVGDNTTDAGRADNRRTEFRIAQLGGKGVYITKTLDGGGKEFK